MKRDWMRGARAISRMTFTSCMIINLVLIFRTGCMTFSPGQVVSRSLLWVSSICKSTSLICIAPILVCLKSLPFAVAKSSLGGCIRRPSAYIWLVVGMHGCIERQKIIDNESERHNWSEMGAQNELALKTNWLSEQNAAHNETRKRKEYRRLFSACAPSFQISGRVGSRTVRRMCSVILKFGSGGKSVQLDSRGSMNPNP